MYTVFEQDIDDRIHVIVLDVPQIDPDLKTFLDSNIVSICEGASGGDVDVVKQELRVLFNEKDFNWKMGAIAEFFMHLHIRRMGFKQEFLYRNLEEGSIKKGFDGLFSKDTIIWLMESKSGSINTADISHVSKIKEAMKDLKDKVAGIGQTNNPWKNAYNHASQIDVCATSSLRADLKKLSDDFISERYRDIKEFNTIPCGTIFLDGVWQMFSSSNIVQGITQITSQLYGKKVIAICMTQNTINLFMNYLNS